MVKDNTGFSCVTKNAFLNSVILIRQPVCYCQLLTMIWNTLTSPMNHYLDQNLKHHETYFPCCGRWKRLRGIDPG
jgi:hypothetical protein